MDIKNITKLITSFRTNTERNSITPEILGALLQAIADTIRDIGLSESGTGMGSGEEVVLRSELSQYAKQQDIQRMLDFDTVNAISLCDIDESSVSIAVGKVNPFSGRDSFDPMAISLPQSSRWNAGIMTAHQASQLEQLASARTLSDWHSLSLERCERQEGMEEVTVLVVEAVGEEKTTLGTFTEPFQDNSQQ